MNNTENQIKISNSFDEKIRPLLDRRITAVAHAIAGSLLGGHDPNAISFRNILNRVMILSQESLTFVVFNGKGEEHYRSNKHEKDKIKLDDCIRKSSVDGRFSIYSTEYKLLVLMYSPEINNRNFCQINCINDKTPETQDDLISYSLNLILNENTFFYYGMGFIEKLKSSIGRCKNFSVKYPKLIFIEPKLRNEIGCMISGMLYENKNFMLENLQENGYLDRVFRKIDKNLKAMSMFYNETENEKSNSSEVSPANYVLFMRDYSRPIKNGEVIKRHGVYDYNIRIALSQSQQRDFENYYHWLKGQPSRLNLYSKRIADNYGEHNWITHISKNLDEWFSKTIVLDGGVQEIIRIIKKPFGNTARSAADPVFDGVSFFRRAFLDGGIQRCFTDDMLQSNTHPISLSEIEDKRYLKRIKKEKIDTSDFSDADIVDDLKRLVVTYYLYNGMIPVVDAHKELSILISPLEIGGKIWACAGYFTQIPMREISDYGMINIEAQEQTFLQNYHIYNDIDERLKKELRHSIIDCYYDLLAYYYAECFKEHNITCILDENKDNEPLTETCVRWINSRYAAITMYLPFDAVSVAIKEGRHAPNAKYGDKENGANITGVLSENQKIYTGAYLTEDYGCVIAIDRNLFFANVPAGTLPEGKSVVNIRDVQVRLSNAILLSYAGQTPIQHSDQEPLKGQKNAH